MQDSQIEALGDVIARQALALQQLETRLAVDQSSGPAMMNGAIEDVQTGRLVKVSIRKSIVSLVKDNIIRYRVY